VNNETLTTSGVTGSAACTTAPQWATVGTYPINCTVGTLSAVNYAFTTFVPGTLTVTSTSPCITGTQSTKLTVNAGQVVCIGAGASINAAVTVNAGGVLDVEGATINGPVRITGSGVIRMCGANVTGPLSVSGATGLVLIGGDAATGACAGNTITAPVELTGNKAGVEFDNNVVNGPLTISGTTGSLPAPDTGSVHAEGNTVSGPIKSTS
jgi:MBG domain (YGX type)